MRHHGASQNLFEIENARNLNPAALARTFVPTRDYWRLLSPKNHIILGTRGSGKTALARMLSHDSLTLLENERAQKLVRAKKYFGVFLSARPEWTSQWALMVEDGPRAAKTRWFTWRLNLALAQAALLTVRSCLQTYVTDVRERANMELRLVRMLSSYWLAEEQGLDNLQRLRLALETLEMRRLTVEAQARVGDPSGAPPSNIGSHFDVEAFLPMRQVMVAMSDVFGLDDATSWFVVIDEAELLSPDQWRVLNTQMRGSGRGLYLKITTMPFHHSTQDTLGDLPVSPGHDLEYVWIGRSQRHSLIPGEDDLDEPVKAEIQTLAFARELFAKRAAESGPRFHGLTLRSLLGRDSELLTNTAGRQSDVDIKFYLDQVREYASPPTIARAERILREEGRDHFMDQIWRKMKGALLLRSAYATQRGQRRTPVYFGEVVVVRLGDSNPRRLVRIFNHLLIAARRRRGRRLTRLAPREQERELFRLSRSELSWVQSERGVGPELHSLLLSVGLYMRMLLHDKPLPTDQTSAFRYDLDLADPVWRALAHGFGIGLIYQNDGDSDDLPTPDSLFRLSYVLAPQFRLLPRRGRARSLKTILEWTRRHAQLVREEATDPQESEDAHA